MQKVNKRKPDRRVAYTIKVIQEAYAEIYRKKHGEKITVAEICKKADINRSTFYLHYTDVAHLNKEIEDKIFDSVVKHTQNSWIDENNRLNVSNLYYDTIRNDSVLSTFGAYSISPSLQKRIVEYAKNIFVDSCLASGQLTKREAEIWAIFIINGAFAISQDFYQHGYENYEEDNAFADKIIQSSSSFIDMNKISEVIKATFQFIN